MPGELGSVFVFSMSLSSSAFVNRRTDVLYGNSALCIVIFPVPILVEFLRRPTAYGLPTIAAQFYTIWGDRWV